MSIMWRSMPGWKVSNLDLNLGAAGAVVHIGQTQDLRQLAGCASMGGYAMAEMKYTAKDSVFSFIFKQPENTRRLYLTLHPEDTGVTEADCKLVTLEHVLTNGVTNDLGFQVRDKLILLVEAQSKFSVNIALPRLSDTSTAFSPPAKGIGATASISPPMALVTFYPQTGTVGPCTRLSVSTSSATPRSIFPFSIIFLTLFHFTSYI